MLIEKINVLKKEKIRLDKEIFVFDSKNKEITDQIEELEIKIKNLQKQKKAKKFQWLSNFNKEIVRLIIKVKKLKEELVENEKNIQPLKNLELKILKDIIKLQNDLYQEEVKNNQEIFQKLDEILENQEFKVVDDIYPSVKNPLDEEDNDTEILNNLTAKIVELENKIADFEKTNENIAIKIQTFENNIDDLREKKAETRWTITCLNIITFGIFKYCKNKKINKEIKILRIKTKNLSEELAENEKNTKPLKIEKLNIMENIIDLQDSMFIKIKMEKEEKIVERLTAIVESQRIAEFDENNPFAGKSMDSSKDSEFVSETKQLDIDGDSLKTFTEEDIEISSASSLSSCSEVLTNNLEQTYTTKSVTV